MLDRETLLKTIDEAYAARVRGDAEALARCWAPDATFRIAGDGSALQGMALPEADPMQSIGALMQAFAFTDLKRLDTVVEGRKAAVLWEVTVSAGDQSTRTQLMDLIEVNEDGKVCAFLQFGDTAAIQRMALPLS